MAASAAGLAPAQPHPLQFSTGAPELIEPSDPAKPGQDRLLTRAEYDAYAAKYTGDWFVPIRKVPGSLSASAGFGVNLVIGGRNRGFAVDGDVRKGYVLRADVDGDGDLGDDPPIPLERRDRYYTALLTANGAGAHEGGSVAGPARIRLLFVRVPTPSGWTIAYRVEDRTARRGTIEVEGRRIAFALLGQPGVHDEPGCSLWIDLDGDGRGIEDEDSIERFLPGDRFVALGGSTYEIRIDPSGASLTLTPSDRKLPERVSLRPGAAAPDFALEDVDGATHRSADYRGKVLLIDAWEVWCHPCRDEAPGLAALYKKYRERGFAILGLTSASRDEISAYAVEFDQEWPQASDPLDGPGHTLFRIVRFPTHLLIDREGRIVLLDSGELDVQPFERALEKALKEPHR